MFLSNFFKRSKTSKTFCWWRRRRTATCPFIRRGSRCARRPSRATSTATCTARWSPTYSSRSSRIRTLRSSATVHSIVCRVAPTILQDARLTLPCLTLSSLSRSLYLSRSPNTFDKSAASLLRFSLLFFFFIIV